MTEKQLEDIVEEYHYGYGEYDITGVIDKVLDLYKSKVKEVETILDEGMLNGLPTHIIAEQVMETLNK